MKTKNFSIAIIFALFEAVFFTISCNQPKDKPSFTKQFNHMGSGQLNVSTSGGNIEVIGHKGDSVDILVFVKENNRIIDQADPRFEELKEGLSITIEKQDDQLIAIAKKTKFASFWNNINVSFFIHIPIHFSCNLNTSGGNIDLTKVEGTQEVNTSGGNIHLRLINGSADANTSGGNISVIAHQGLLKVNTSGGNIALEDINGNIDGKTSGGNVTVKISTGTIDVETSGGNIELDEINGPVNAQTSGGSIDIIGTSENVYAYTSGGNIKADISGLSQSLKLETSGGGIQATIPKSIGIDLTLEADRVNVELERFSGISKKNYVMGKLNGGGIPVIMKSSGGKIDLKFQ